MKIQLLAAALALGACDEAPSPPARRGPSDSEQASGRAEPARREISLDGVENGVAAVTRNFYFIIDGSGSMKDPCAGDKEFTRKVDGAKWAVGEFLRQVPADVNLGLWVFDQRGMGERVALGPENRAAFSQAVEAIEAGGATPLADAIRAGVERLIAQYQRQLGYGEFRLVIVTDGIAEGIEEAADLASSYGFPIYTIGFCIDVYHPLRHLSVSYRAADSAADLQAGLEAAVAEIETFDATSFQK